MGRSREKLNPSAVLPVIPNTLGLLGNLITTRVGQRRKVAARWHGAGKVSKRRSPDGRRDARRKCYGSPSSSRDAKQRWP